MRIGFAGCKNDYRKTAKSCLNHTWLKTRSQWYTVWFGQQSAWNFAAIIDETFQFALLMGKSRMKAVPVKSIKRAHWTAPLPFRMSKPAMPNINAAEAETRMRCRDHVMSIWRMQFCVFESITSPQRPVHVATRPVWNRAQLNRSIWRSWRCDSAISAPDWTLGDATRPDWQSSRVSSGSFKSASAYFRHALEISSLIFLNLSKTVGHFLHFSLGLNDVYLT